MRRTPPYSAAALAALSLGVAACGGDDEEPRAGRPRPTADGHRGRRSGQITKNPDNAKVTLKIGSKNFTEQKVLGEIYAQGLAAAGYNTSTDLNLGDQDTALAALKGGQIDAYPEYTGTALTVVLQEGRGRPAQGPAGGLRGGQGPSSRRTASPPSRRRRSPPPTRSR